jgi:hypothetical protein
VKTLYQKLIKIDLLLSHVKLNKISLVTSPSKQKKSFKKIHPKYPTRIRKTENRPLENRPLVGFQFIENRSVSVSVSRRALL